MWLKRLVIFLVRKRLGLKKYEHFQFDNQKSDATYFFSDAVVMKDTGNTVRLSTVSLNWLLNDDCRIIKVNK